MAKVYHVLTGNYLHKSKKIFESIQDAIAHIKMIVDMKEDWVKNHQVLCSYSLTEIDTDEVPKYAKIFKSSELIEPPHPPTDSELNGRPKKLSKSQKVYKSIVDVKIDKNKPISEGQI